MDRRLDRLECDVKWKVQAKSKTFTKERIFRAVVNVIVQNPDRPLLICKPL